MDRFKESEHYELGSIGYSDLKYHDYFKIA